MNKHLHIISFDIPYPVSYGGLFDVFYKIVELHRHGIKIHLHCFAKDIVEQAELKKYCAAVYYYKRRRGVSGISLTRPYIVASRVNEQLLERLAADDFPILLEGIHCTALIGDKRFAGRSIMLRLHNVEYKYYSQLYHSSYAILRKLYYLWESRLLKKYEAKIASQPALIIAMATVDVNTYRAEFPGTNIEYLPVFHGFGFSPPIAGTGSYCLYHGNLAVSENEQAAIWLIENVFNDIDVPLIIAGKDPSQRLMKAAGMHKSISLVANPSEAELQNIIHHAQIHTLPSFSHTGIKLKWLNALYNGRHCIVNTNTSENGELDAVCHVARNATIFKKLIVELFTRPYTEEDMYMRKNVLDKLFDTERNVSLLIKWLY